jgi:deoxyribose-phosphate aldolase
MVEAGATRIGASAGVKIVQDAKEGKKEAAAPAAPSKGY